MKKLMVKSIFTSIDGEHNGYTGQGELSTFVRLAGCSLKCSFCDTKYSWSKKEGTEMGSGKLLDVIEDKGINKITITGGEPLEQPEGVINLINLLSLFSGKYRISIETNGVTPIPFEYFVYPSKDVRFIVDYKPKTLVNVTGERSGIRTGNLKKMTHRDILKFIISCREDFNEAVDIIKTAGLSTRYVVSPLYSLCNPRDLVEWIIEEKLQAIPINLQLHKYIWPECINSEIEK